MKLLSSRLSISCTLSLLSLLTCFIEQSKAYIITSVTAPNLSRPPNGILYDFTITVRGTYDQVDVDRGAVVVGDVLSFNAEYWDEDVFLFLDDEIDLTGMLKIPNPPVNGNPWGPVNVTFKVGCTTNSKVFGPSGETGENPMDDGYFRFQSWAGGFSEWGYNTVTCQMGNPDTMLPDPDIKPIPEPLTMLGSATALGFGAFFKRKLKPSKPAEKETTKVS